MHHTCNVFFEIYLLNKIFFAILYILFAIYIFCNASYLQYIFFQCIINAIYFLQYIFCRFAELHRYSAQIQRIYRNGIDILQICNIFFAMYLFCNNTFRYEQGAMKIRSEILAKATSQKLLKLQRTTQTKGVRGALFLTMITAGCVVTYSSSSSFQLGLKLLLIGAQHLKQLASTFSQVFSPHSVRDRPREVSNMKAQVQKNRQHYIDSQARR